MIYLIKKRILALLLTVLMLLTIVPVTVFATETEYEVQIIRNGEVVQSCGNFDNSFDTDVTTKVQNGDTIILLKDVSTGGISLGTNGLISQVTVDLNGHNIVSKYGDMFSLIAGCSLVITDSTGDNNGQIIPSNGNGIFYVKGATVEIKGGAYLINDGGFAYCKSGGSITIEGGIFSEDPSDYVADGYKVFNYDDTTYTYKVGKPVAKIDETEYASIKDAIRAVPEGTEETTEIDVIANISDEFSVDNFMVIPSNKNIVLDLNGYTVAGHGTNNSHSYYLYNKGYLTIKDSSEEETGVITYYSNNPDPGYWYGTSTILNRGELTLESGKIKNTTKGGASYAVDIQVLWYDDLNPIKFTMKGGVISCTSGDAALRQAATLGETYKLKGDIVGNEVLIKDGTVEGDIWIQSSEVNGVGSHSTLTIEGGIITGTVYDTLTGNGSNLVYDIKGGYFGTINMHRTGKGSFKEGFVSGGYFKNEVLATEVAPGYECVKIAEKADKTATDTEAMNTGYVYTLGVVASDIIVEKPTEEKVTEIKGDVEKEVEDEVGTLEEEQKTVLKDAVDTAVETLNNNTEVTKVETNAKDAVKEEKVSDIIARAAQQAEDKESGSGEAFTGGTDVKTDTKIEVKLESVKVDTQTVVSAQASTDITVNTSVYDVKPVATVTTTITKEGGETETKTETVILTNEDLNGKDITVRLAVTPTNAQMAKITHKGDGGHEDEVFYAPIQGEGSNQFVEIKMNHFSEVEVETLQKKSSEKHLMGHQDKVGSSGVGRAIIPLTQSELNSIENNVFVVGGEGEKITSFEIESAYTFFYNDNEIVEAGSIGNYVAFLIIDKDADDNAISGYGYYRFYNGNSANEENFLFDATFNKK